MKVTIKRTRTVRPTTPGRAVLKEFVIHATPELAAAAGTAAGAAAGPVAYAGVAGTLTQVGVALGLINPPALVVGATVAGTVAVLAGSAWLVEQM